MSHNAFDQFNALVTQLAAADVPSAAAHAHEVLDTALAREMLEAIVAGQRPASLDNPYEQGEVARFRGRYTLRTGESDSLID